MNTPKQKLRDYIETHFISGSDFHVKSNFKIDELEEMEYLVHDVILQVYEETFQDDIKRRSGTP